MKWYKAALQGGAQRYMDVTAQERSYAAEQALRDADNAAAAKSSNNENSMMFGDKKFTWRDPGDILGGDWQEKKARVDDFSGFLKDNFYTNNIFDQTKWNTFRNGNETAADAIKNEWTSSLEAWMYPNPTYHEKVSKNKKWLLKKIPFYARWYRFLLFWPGSDGLMPSLIVDKDWKHQERSVNEMNDNQRKEFTKFIKDQIGDDELLLSKVLPTYPPFLKRILQDDGSWLRALKKNNVTLINESIKEISSSSISAGDNNYEVDIIIYATGFHGTEFLSSFEVQGKQEKTLSELWKDEPEAYLGIAIPNFPNLFCLYGPATNLAHAGTIIFNSECQVRYIMECIKYLVNHESEVIECKEKINIEYNSRLQKALSATVFSHTSADSWYKNSKGNVVTTSPWLLKDYWKWTRTINPLDYYVS